MKIHCAKDKLQHAVQTVQKAVSTKAALPVISGIYLSAADGKLELQANDYELGIRCLIDAEVEEEGQVVISGRYFQDMVRKLPGDTVSLGTSKSDRTLEITAGAAQFNLLSLPPEEFPVIKQLSPANCLILKNHVLREMIKRTIFACSTDEARPVFTGGLLEADNHEVRMVATNTHRLALKKYTVDNLASTVKMIIPSKILNELGRLIASDDEMDVNIFWQRNQIAFSYDDVYMVARLIEGQFPDYNRVIPPDFSTRVTVNTDLFMSAVERASLLAFGGEYNVVKFKFSQDGIVITSNNPDVGKACETVPASMDGTELEIAFNARYVTDIMKNIDSEQFLFSLNTALSPASIKPLDDDQYIYIITPVRTA